jgi:predicted N-acetyltransferase YhbS/putative sterol carrier protein
MVVNEEPRHIVRFYEDRDENEVIEIVTDTFSALSKDLWVWKYLENPSFDKSLVFVAENNGRIIGCMHYLPRDLKISRTLKINAVLGADFAIRENYRNQGVGSSILRFSRSSGILKSKSVILTYGFIDRRRAHFYKRNIDSFIIPLETALYRKFFDAVPAVERLVPLDGLTGSEGTIVDELKETRMNVLFRLTGMPPFTLKINNGRINLDREEIKNADLVVEGDPYFLESLYEGSKGIFSAFVGMLMGKIKIRGGLLKILAFYKIEKAIKSRNLRKVNMANSS